MLQISFAEFNNVLVSGVCSFKITTLVFDGYKPSNKNLRYDTLIRIHTILFMPFLNKYTLRYPRIV